MLVSIDQLDFSLQTRAGTDAETINNYAEAMSDGAQFPNVTVFSDGSTFWLSDGFHRVMAAKQIGKKQISADIRKGTEDDAVVFGGTANNKQGKRPTRADQRHFMEMVWERRDAIFGGTPTGGNFAEKCGVSRDTGVRFCQLKLAEMPVAPVRPPVKIGQVTTDSPLPMVNVTTDSTVKVGQLKMPTRPTQLVGKNGKMYPARPNPTVSKIQLPEAKPAHLVPLDRYGTEIPIEINDAFEGDTLKEVISLLRDARSILSHGLDEGAVQFRAVRQEALILLNNAYSFVKAAKAHCVCRICQGQGCKACHERGWQTEEEYERNPAEFKAQVL